MTFTATTDQILRDHPIYTTAGGKPTVPPAGAVPSWTPGDPTIATLVPSADNTECTITAVTTGDYTYGFSDGLGMAYTQTVTFTAPVATGVISGLSIE